MKPFNPLFFSTGPDLIVLDQLPPGVQELKYAKPKRAVGLGLRQFYFCNQCEGWIAGAPLIQTESDSEAFKEGRTGKVSRCRRCGAELSFTGVYNKEEVKQVKEQKETKKPEIPRIMRGTGGIGG